MCRTPQPTDCCGCAHICACTHTHSLPHRNGKVKNNMSPKWRIRDRVHCLLLLEKTADHWLVPLLQAAHWPQAKREVPGELARWKEAWTHGTWGTDWPCRPELWACTYPPVCAASSCRLRSRQPQAPRCLGPQSEVVVCGCSVNEPGAPGDRWPRGHHDQASFHHVAPAAPLCAFFTSKRLLSVNCTGWRKKELRVLSPHRVSLNKLNTTTTLHQDELHPKPWHPGKRMFWEMELPSRSHRDHSPKVTLSIHSKFVFLKVCISSN